MAKKTPLKMDKLKSKTVNPQLLRVLMVEDSEDDVLLIIREMKKGGYNPVYERVETAAAMKKALQEKQWDIILSDYKMPHFSGKQAIALLKETNIDIPIIIVSGTIGEDVAVECMRLGAQNYIMKGNLLRLCPAIVRELEEADSRSKRKQVEKALQESEEKYRNLVERASDGIGIAQEGILRYANARLAQIAGYSVEEIIWKPFIDFFMPEEVPKVLDRYKRRMAGKKITPVYETALRHKNGSRVDVEVNAGVITYERKPADLVLVRDITERLRAEEALRKSEEYFKEITENSSDIIIITDKNGDIKYCSRSIERFTGYKPEELIGRSALTLIHPDDKKRSVGDFGKAILAIDSAIPNAFRIVHKDGSERYFDGLGKNLLDNPTVAGFIMNVRDITERKQAEEALQETEKHYRQLAEDMPAFICTFLPDSTLTYVNPAYCEIFQKRADELVGQKFLDFLPDEAIREKVRRQCMSLTPENPLHTYEHKLIVSDGTGQYHWHRWTDRAFFNDKFEISHFQSIGQDITKRKQAEEALTASEAQYRWLSEHITDGVWLLDMNLKPTYQSPSMEKLTGFTHEELMELPLEKRVTPESLKLALELFLELLPRIMADSDYNPRRTLELEYYCKDGTILWTENKLSGIRDENGKPVSILAEVRNITERKQAEDALRESEEKYRFMLDNMADVITVMDMNLRFTYVSPSIMRMRGYTAEEATAQTFEQVMTPESLQIAAKIFEEEMKLEASGTADPDRSRIVEVEQYKKDGSIVWMENTLSFMRDEAKKPVGIISMSRDITERKQAEEALKKSEESFRLSLDDSPLGVRIITEKGETLYANRATLEIYGYDSIEELKKTPLKERYTPESYAEFQIRKEKRGRGEFGPSEYEISIVRKNGKVRHVQVFRKEVWWNGARQFQIIYQDITERKQAKKTLLETQKLLQDAYRLAEIGIWSWNFSDKTITWSEELYQMTGQKFQELGFRDTKHPPIYTRKSWELVKKAVDDCLKTGKSYQLEAQIVHPDGNNHWLNWIGGLIYDDSGKIIGMHGTAQNITERKQAEKERKQSFERLRKALRATVQAISRTVEMKDPYTSGHQQRVSDLARSIATEMGLSADRQDFIRTASTIHDIGKIALPTEILSKPTKLTDLEFDLIKTHSQAGYDILKDIEFPWSVANIVLQHHERMDGSGYPQGLKGDDILLEARILAVADVVEAIASHRPYRPARGIDFALEEISRNKGILYDADAVDACLKLFLEKGYTLVLKKVADNDRNVKWDS